jgi:hypothetical protein
MLVVLLPGLLVCEPLLVQLLCRAVLLLPWSVVLLVMCCAVLLMPCCAVCLHPVLVPRSLLLTALQQLQQCQAWLLLLLLLLLPPPLLLLCPVPHPEPPVPPQKTLAKAPAAAGTAQCMVTTCQDVCGATTAVARRPQPAAICALPCARPCWHAAACMVPSRLPMQAVLPLRH